MKELCENMHNYLNIFQIDTMIVSMTFHIQIAVFNLILIGTLIKQRKNYEKREQNLRKKTNLNITIKQFQNYEIMTSISTKVNITVLHSQFSEPLPRMGSVL